MELEAIVQQLTAGSPVISVGLMIMGTLVMTATVVVKLTKSDKDDQALARIRAHGVAGPILRFLERFSVIVPKAALEQLKAQ
jgi:hypothetical protein